MDYELYGFIINKDIHFDIANKRIYRLSSSGAERNITFCTIYLNETMIRLFIYLLEHANNKNITRDELLEKIWEEKNLSASSQRLWRVLQDLNEKLAMLGAEDEFIKNHKGKGYIVTCKDITALYSFQNGNETDSQESMYV